MRAVCLFERFRCLSHSFDFSRLYSVRDWDLDSAGLLVMIGKHAKSFMQIALHLFAPSSCGVLNDVVGVEFVWTLLDRLTSSVARAISTLGDLISVPLCVPPEGEPVPLAGNLKRQRAL